MYPKIHTINNQIAEISLFMPETFEGASRFGFVLYVYNPTEPFLSIVDVSTTISDTSMHYSKNTEVLRSVFLKNDAIVFNVLLMMKSTDGTLEYNHITQDIAPAILTTTYVI